MEHQPSGIEDRCDNEPSKAARADFFILREAIHAVPAIKVGFAVAALGLLVVIVRAWATDLRIALFGIPVLILGMVIVLLFAVLYERTYKAVLADVVHRDAFSLALRKHLVRVILILTWFALVTFICFVGLSLTSLFARWPLDFARWVVDDSTAVPADRLNRAIIAAEAAADREKSVEERLRVVENEMAKRRSADAELAKRGDAEAAAAQGFAAEAETAKRRAAEAEVVKVRAERDEEHRRLVLLTVERDRLQTEADQARRDREQKATEAVSLFERTERFTVPPDITAKVNLLEHHLRRSECRRKLKEIGIAVKKYYEAHKELPFLHSLNEVPFAWIDRLTPYLENVTREELLREYVPVVGETHLSDGQEMMFIEVLSDRAPAKGYFTPDAAFEEFRSANPHPSGRLVLLNDGSVIFINENIDDSTLRASLPYPKVNAQNEP